MMTQASPERANMGFIILIVAVATIGGFLFGFDSGVINGTVPGLQRAFESTAVGTGFNVASMLLGCAFGAFAAGRLSDLIGRRNVLLISAEARDPDEAARIANRESSAMARVQAESTPCSASRRITNSSGTRPTEFHNPPACIPPCSSSTSR